MRDRDLTEPGVRGLDVLALLVSIYGDQAPLSRTALYCTLLYCTLLCCAISRSYEQKQDRAVSTIQPIHSTRPNKTRLENEPAVALMCTVSLT